MAAALVVAATSSTGCFWIAVGGAGSVGYEVAKDDRTTGTKFNDASIPTGVKARSIHDEQVDALDINIDTYEGTATSNGSVPSKRVDGRAMQIARGVKGAKRVRSEFVILPR